MRGAREEAPEAEGCRGPALRPAQPHLLDARDGHLLRHAPCLPFPGEVVVYLARTEQKPLDVFRVLGGKAIFWDDPLEVGSCETIPAAGASLRTWRRTPRALPLLSCPVGAPGAGL